MKLNIENLSAGYDSGVVLKNLSLSVREGEFLSLLGPSGCGKTTLMKTIAGILPASSGKIFLDGQDITDLPIRKRGTVVVFQDMRLFPNMTVAENVAFPLKMQGISKKERLNAAKELLEKVQMAPFAARKPAALSGGQQQRAALARALAAKPRLLLLDEPFSALDENLREEMRSLVLSLAKEFSMTVILVTHDRAEALSMSDRVALLFDGELAQTGTPREVYERPATRRVADYFGGGVYISGAVEQGVFRGGGITCPVRNADGPYTLMLRPEHLRLGEGSYKMRVEQLTYRGSDTLATLRSTGGIQWKVPSHSGWQIGDEMTARIDTADPILFSD